MADLRDLVAGLRALAGELRPAEGEVRSFAAAAEEAAAKKAAARAAMRAAAPVGEGAEATARSLTALRSPSPAAYVEPGVEGAEEAFGVPAQTSLGDWLAKREALRAQGTELPGLRGGELAEKRGDIIGQAFAPREAGELPFGGTAYEIAGTRPVAPTATQLLPPSTSPGLTISYDAAQAQRVAVARELVGLPRSFPLTAPEATEILHTLDKGTKAAQVIYGAPGLAEAEKAFGDSFPELLNPPVLDPYLGGAGVADAVARQADAYSARLAYRALADKAVEGLDKALAAKDETAAATFVEKTARYRMRQLEYDGRIQMLNERVASDAAPPARAQALFHGAARTIYALSLDPGNKQLRTLFGETMAKVVFDADRDARDTATLVNFLDGAFSSRLLDPADLPHDLLVWHKTAKATLNSLSALHAADEIGAKRAALALTLDSPPVRTQLGELVPAFRRSQARIAESGWMDPETLMEFSRDAVMATTNAERRALELGAKLVDKAAEFHSYPIPSADAVTAYLPRELKARLMMPGEGGEMVWKGTLGEEGAKRLHSLIQNAEKMTPEDVDKEIKALFVGGKDASGKRVPALAKNIGKAEEEAHPQLFPAKLAETGAFGVTDATGATYRYEIRDYFRELAAKTGYEVEFVRTPLLEASYANLEGVCAKMLAKEALTSEEIASLQNAMTRAEYAFAESGTRTKAGRSASIFAKPKFTPGRLSLVHDLPSSRLAADFPAEMKNVANQLGEVILVRGRRGAVRPFYDFRSALAYLHAAGQEGTLANAMRGKVGGKIPLDELMSGLPGRADAWLSLAIKDVSPGNSATVGARVLGESLPVNVIPTAGTHDPATVGQALTKLKEWMEKTETNTTASLFNHPDFLDAVGAGDARSAELLAARKVALDLRNAREAVEFDRTPHLPSIGVPTAAVDAGLDAAQAASYDPMQAEIYEHFTEMLKPELDDVKRLALTKGVKLRTFDEVVTEAADEFARKGGC